MNVPRTSTLFRIDGMTDTIAASIRGMISGELYPAEESDAADRWRGQCFHEPDHLSLVLCAINDLLDCHGVECVPYADDSSFLRGPRFSYCNTGDSYATTVCYDHGRGRFVVCGWADLAS